jgi:hypothetical protein
MPKVKQETYCFHEGQFLAVFNIDASGAFTCKLPDYMAEILGYALVQSDTLDKCQKAFKEATTAYHNAKTVSSKVILYETEATAHIWDKKHERVIYNDKQIAFTHGAAVSVAALVMDEFVTTHANGKKTYRYKRVADSKLNKSSAGICADFRTLNEYCETQMPWTQEREDFFLKISTAMEAVIMQLQQLRNGEKALAIADSGQLALPENTDDTKTKTNSSR